MEKARLPSAATDGQTDAGFSDEERPANTATPILCQPETLAELLQNLCDGPIINAVNVNKSSKSRVERACLGFVENPGWLAGKARGRWQARRAR
jgi:hypothetical protein